jgi:hypothetical protein
MTSTEHSTRGMPVVAPGLIGPSILILLIRARNPASAQDSLDPQDGPTT